MPEEPAVDLLSVDSFVTTVKYRNDLTALTKDLTDPYPQQLLKARAIFKWITDNIVYDRRDYNRHELKGKERKSLKCRNDEDCTAKMQAWETRYIDRVLRKKKAICQGYAMLFKRMCDIAGLRAEFVPGYTRTEYYQVGTPGSLNHAWNALWIDSTYHLLDATWAAGGCAKEEDGRLEKFARHFNNYYWLTTPEDFARDHFPKDSIWVLIPHYSKEDFSSNPYYKPEVLNDTKLISPASGVINAKKGDTLHFKIECGLISDTLQINSNFFRNPDIWVEDESLPKRRRTKKLDTLALKKQQYIKFNRSGALYTFEYVLPDDSIYYLDVLFDRSRILRFKVNPTHPTPTSSQ
ncbi:transglutaminase domain-containing protein [Puia sp. P3]|uniref:transglutaminase domain-containing protein n=1 Tax=Puia sp. P3 TaxID=3423952 RepID=UPI003D678F02